MTGAGGMLLVTCQDASYLEIDDREEIIHDGVV